MYIRIYLTMDQESYLTLSDCHWQTSGGGLKATTGGKMFLVVVLIDFEW